MKRRSLCAALLAMVMACGLLLPLGTVAQAAKDRWWWPSVPTSPRGPHMHSSRLHTSLTTTSTTPCCTAPQDSYKPGPGLATSIRSLNPTTWELSSARE